MSATEATEFVVGRDELDLDTFAAVAEGRLSVALDAGAHERIATCDVFRRELVASERRIYGVNTGFGRLADTVIPREQQHLLQDNLIRSHAVGWGPPLSRAEVRGMVLLRAASLSRGHSGVRPEVVDQLLWLLREDVCPWVPSRGSVGASGDLAPLAHLALVLMGEGWILTADGDRRGAGPELAARGREPLRLQAKEGLALINGTQMMNSLGLLAARRGRNLVAVAALASALSLEAIEGTTAPLGAAYHALRPHAAIGTVAAVLRELLHGSGVAAGHRDCARVQDPYSIRCAPQVLGSSLAVLRTASALFLREADSVTDNPVLFPTTGEVVSGGHFHGQPLALQLDFCYQAVAELANIAERRIALLMGGNGGRLPRFLAAEPGLESGLMIAQYLAAALVSENKTKAQPAAIDSVPTSDGQEDHVSMGSVAALKLPGVLARTEAVVALEAICAARALQYICDPDLARSRGRRPLTLSGPLAAFVAALAERIDLTPGDRPLTDDVATVQGMLRDLELPATTAACLDPILREDTT